MLQLKLLDHGFDIEAQELNMFKSQSVMTNDADLQAKMLELENLIQQQGSIT